MCNNYIALFLDVLQSTDEELISKSKSFLMSALQKSVDNPINNLNVAGVTTPGNKVKILSQEFICALQAKPDLHFSTSINLVGKLAIIVKRVNFLKQSSRENMWHEIMMLTQSDNMLETWKEVVPHSEFKKATFRTLFYSVCMEIVTVIIKYENEQKNHNISDKELDINLTDEEQQIIYYVSGYIVFSLLRKYQKIQSKNPMNVAATAVIQFLISLKMKHSSAVEGASFFQFTKKWIDVVNRGGLVKVCDEMFIFIRLIENSMREILNLNLIKSYHGQDLREIIQVNLENSPFISKSWEKISRNVSNKDITDLVKKQIIIKWIDIRAQSFVSSYVQILKRKLSSISSDKKKEALSKILSKASEPALRKTLT